MSKKLIQGAILEDLNCYLYPILGFDDYRVTDNGNVYRISKPNTGHTWEGPDEVELVESYSTHRGGNQLCKIKNNNGTYYEVPIAKLLLSSRIGDLNLPIKFRDQDYSNVTLRNIFYDFTEFDIIRNKEKSNIIYIRNYINGYMNEMREDPLSPGYFVSDEGAVYNSYKNTLILRKMSYTQSLQYYRVYVHIQSGDLSLDKNDYTKVHQMVYRAWVGLYDGLVIDHLNMKQYDNRLENLEAVTNEENIRRAHSMRYDREKYNGYGRYAVEDIEKLCQLMEDGGSFDECMDLMISLGYKFERRDICTGLIRKLRDGSSFSNIASKYDFNKNAHIRKHKNNFAKRKFDTNIVKKELENYITGKITFDELLIQCNTSRGTIKRILQGYPTYFDIWEDNSIIKDYIFNIYPLKNNSYTNGTLQS